MTWAASPEWLLELQRSFGAMLRAPLDRSSGTLTAEISRYDPALLGLVKPTRGSSAAELLAVYHRQYWFRLLTVMQRAYPLTARLMGFWSFNGLAATHLLAAPPRGFDVDGITEGFDDWVAGELRGAGAGELVPGIEPSAVVQAARIDAAFHRVLRAGPQPAFRPLAEDGPRLAGARLILSSSVALVSEDWPLCEQRASLEGTSAATSWSLGSRHAETKHYLLARRELRLGLVALAPLEARLLELLSNERVGDALAQLEAECPTSERSSLPARAQGWLARSVKLQVWTSMLASND